jgi:alkanesulfonate monooxygenase SsuD/methylene tetrahydromethanopterin reductase-like flavin-dependent oxidoreductase (luciferase family)
MKLDLLYEFEAPEPWAGEHPYGQRAVEQRVYRECFEQLVFADSLGFNTAWMVEHHFRKGRSHMPCSEAVLGALSQRTKQLKMGFGVTLMPHGFIHPARVAEKVATVDILSQGRVQWGTGRSTPMEQTAFHVDRPRSKDQWRAAVKTVVGMWESEYYEEHSEFLDFPRRMVTPKPFQDPHPPAWVAASPRTPESAQIAGRAGMGMLSLSIMLPVEKLAEQVGWYREAAANPEPITRVTTNKVAAYTIVHCADSHDDIERNHVWDAVKYWYRTLAAFTLEWELPNLSDAEKEKAFPHHARIRDPDFDPHVFGDADMIIIGTPDECLAKLSRYEEIGIDAVLAFVQFGGVPHEATMRSMELLGQKVIPELARHEQEMMTAPAAH